MAASASRRISSVTFIICSANLSPASSRMATPSPASFCEQNTLTRHIFSCLHACLTVSHVTLAQGVVRVIPSMFHPLVCLTSLRLSTLHSSQSLPSSSSSSMWVGSERNSPCASANEESDSLVNNASLTGYEPKIFDDYHYSETTEIFIQESTSDTRPSNLHDSEISDYTIGRAHSSPLFTQEREEPASRRQAYHSPDDSLSSSQSSSVGHVRTGRPVSDQFDLLIPNIKKSVSRLRKRANQDSL